MIIISVDNGAVFVLNWFIKFERTQFFICDIIGVVLKEPLDNACVSEDNNVFLGQNKESWLIINSGSLDLFKIVSVQVHDLVFVNNVDVVLLIPNGILETISDVE